MSETGQRGRLTIDPASLPLLTLLGRLRCASYEHLKALLCGQAPDHDLVRSIEALCNDELVQIVPLPHGRHGYGLTERAIRCVPALRAQFKVSTAKINPRAAVRGWQRAALWAHYTRQGALVLTGKTAVGALRENRLAALEGQGGSAAGLDALRERVDACFSVAGEAAALDVARLRDGTCTLLVADDPYRRMLAQLEALPIAISAYDRETGCAAYLPRLPVIFVPSDEESCWDDAKNDWACRGPRLRQWQRYTNDARGHDGFPFCKVLVNGDPPPQAILHRRRASTRMFSQVNATHVAPA